VVLVLPAKVVRAIKVEVSRPCICLGASPEVANQNLNIVFELFISSKTQNWIVLAPTFGSLVIQVHVGVWREQESNLTLCVWRLSCSSTRCQRDFFSDQVTRAPCLNQLAIDGRVCFWALNSVLLICVSVLVSPPPAS
jgi:hypothetical protein